MPATVQADPMPTQVPRTQSISIAGELYQHGPFLRAQGCLRQSEGLERLAIVGGCTCDDVGRGRLWMSTLATLTLVDVEGALPNLWLTRNLGVRPKS